MQKQKVRVLIVDDSALMRQMLTTMLNSDPDIDVVGTASDPIVARRKIKELQPDVVTLDIEMPNMDGLAFLEKIMALRPMPVVMVSSLTQMGAEATIRALEIGAVDFVSKPTEDLVTNFSALSTEICVKVKMAAKIKVAARRSAPRPAIDHLPSGRRFETTERIVAIGASTGGVEALRHIISTLPADAPAILITQHMPPKYTASFARRLNDISSVTIYEARDGQRVLPGHVYMAPGGRHLELCRSGANYVCRLQDEAPLSGHRPSVDVLFNSVAQAAGANAMGIILTGMGRDGASGLLSMRRAGALTVGQDEASSIVYGMPKVAFETGAVGVQLPIELIAEQIVGVGLEDGARRIRV